MITLWGDTFGASAVVQDLAEHETGAQVEQDVDHFAGRHHSASGHALYCRVDRGDARPACVRWGCCALVVWFVERSMLPARNDVEIIAASQPAYVTREG
jgi:hypothetical protein